MAAALAIPLVPMLINAAVGIGAPALRPLPLSAPGDRKNSAQPYRFARQGEDQAHIRQVQPIASPRP
jgi:hypothetical protein